MRVIGLALVLVCLVSTAWGQEGSIYRGEIIVSLKNGDEVTTDWLFVKGDEVKVEEGRKGTRYATAVVDHIVVALPEGGSLYLEPALLHTGYNSQQTSAWLIKRWETLRIAYYERQVYRQTNTAGRGRGTKAISYYYRKDGGELLAVNTSNVEQSVADHPLAFAMLDDMARRRQGGLILQMASLAAGVGIVLAGDEAPMDGEYTQVGGMAVAVAAFGIGLNLSAGADKHLEGALHLYK